MTEIPEHLLKRSKERRAALGGDPAPGDAPAAAPAAAPAQASASTPAVAAAAAPPASTQPPLPPAPTPDPPYVAAYKARKKIPVWVMFTLSILPIWAFMYVRSLTPVAEKVTGPLGDGTTLYRSCSSCHSAGGEGGAGRKLNDGEVLKTFPRIEDQLNFVYWGTEGYEAAGISQYGDPNRQGGAHSTRSYNGAAMPKNGKLAGGELTDAQILAVVCHERFGFSGGLDPIEENPEYVKWCSPDSAIWLGLETGELSFDQSPELADVGGAPRASLADQTPPAA